MLKQCYFDQISLKNTAISLKLQMSITFFPKRILDLFPENSLSNNTNLFTYGYRHFFLPSTTKLTILCTVTLGVGFLSILINTVAMHVTVNNWT